MSLLRPLRNLLFRYRKRKKLAMDGNTTGLPYQRLSRRTQGYAGEYQARTVYAAAGPAAYHPSLFAPTVHWTNYETYHANDQSAQTPLIFTQPRLSHQEFEAPRDTVGLQRRLEMLQDTFIDSDGDDIHALFFRPPVKQTPIEPDTLPEFGVMLDAYSQLKEVFPEDHPDLVNLTRAMWSHSLNNAPQLSDFHQDLVQQQQEIHDHNLSIAQDILPTWEIAEDVFQEQRPLLEEMVQRAQGGFSESHSNLLSLAQIPQSQNTFPETEITDQWTSNSPSSDLYVLTPAEQAESMFYGQMGTESTDHLPTPESQWQDEVREFEPMYKRSDIPADLSLLQDGGKVLPNSLLHNDSLGGLIGSNTLPGEDVAALDEVMQESVFEDNSHVSPFDLEQVVQQTMDGLPIEQDVHANNMAMHMEVFQPESQTINVTDSPAAEINEAIDQVVQPDFPDPTQELDDLLMNPYQRGPFGGMPDPFAMPGPGM